MSGMRETAHREAAQQQMLLTVTASTASRIFSPVESGPMPNVPYCVTFGAQEMIRRWVTTSHHCRWRRGRPPLEWHDHEHPSVGFMQVCGCFQSRGVAVWLVLNGRPRLLQATPRRFQGRSEHSCSSNKASAHSVMPLERLCELLLARRRLAAHSLLTEQSFDNWHPLLGSASRSPVMCLQAAPVSWRLSVRRCP